jgi:DNA polymerase
MNVVALDFETFYDSNYTLKKMTTEAYVRDARFACLSVALRLSDGSTIARGGHDAPRLLWRAVDWSKTAVLCHHAHFDAFILSHHFGLRPALILDTLSMARLAFPAMKSHSLDALAKHFGLGVKSVPYDAFRGKHWRDLSSEAQGAILGGNAQDVRLTWELFRRLSPFVPAEELAVIDMTVRMFSEPRLIGDATTFRRLEAEEKHRKAAALAELGVKAIDLQSVARFQSLLEAQGVEMEWKQGKNGPIPACAKSDQFMQDLLDSDDPRVAALASARLDVRSVIQETHAGRFAASAGRGPMPVYLKYCGANTLRFSGGDKTNFQNMTRGSELRRGIRAPAGHLLAVVDKSQIELRYAMALAGQTDVLDALRAGRDIYCEFATEFYGRPITKADKTERMFGKVTRLAGQYGMGAAKFQKVAKCDDQTAVSAIQTYRRLTNRVVAYWKYLDGLLPRLASGEKSQPDGPFTLDGGRIILPNGAAMVYDIEWSSEWSSWVRLTRDGRKRIWGGVVLQNLCGALSRLELTQTCLRVKKEAGLQPALLVHDEGVWVIRDDANAQATFDFLIAEMKRPPAWMPDIPLDAEGILSVVYEK